MPKIITFTANLLAETTYEFSSWQEGKTQRAVRQSFQVGGKGINVSKMLNRLSANNAALCFPGGDFGAVSVKWMNNAGLELMPYVHSCETRSGSVVRGNGPEETTFLGTESVVSEESVRMAADALASITDPIVFAICGSIQFWNEPRWDALRNWISNRGENVTLVVDNYGPSLPWLTRQSPEIVKFNRDELELLFEEAERSLSTNELLVLAAQKFDCPKWVVTDGGRPIWFKEGQDLPQKIEPPQVECVSPTGCGDVFFATLLDCLYNKKGYGLSESVSLAADYASRSAAQSGIAEFEL